MLTILRGLPGAGKSHYAKNKFGGALVIEADQRFVEPDGSFNWNPSIDDRPYVTDMLHTAFRNHLSHVILTTTEGSQQAIQRYIDLARTYNHPSQVMWLDHMNGSAYNIHNVPKGAIHRMKASWELFPHETYARRVLNGSSDGSAYCIKIVDTPPPWFIELHPELKGETQHHD